MILVFLLACDMLKLLRCDRLALSSATFFGEASTMVPIALAMLLLASESDLTKYDVRYVGVLTVEMHVARATFEDIRFPSKSGLVVVAVDPYGPAHGKLGLLDVIDVANGKKISTPIDLQAAIDDTEPGSSIRLVGYRAHDLGRFVGFSDRKAIEVQPVPWKNALLASIDAKKDEVDLKTTISHKDQPSIYDPTAISAYFIVQDGNVGPLRLRIHYRSEGFIFFERLTVRCGEEAFSITFPRDVRNTDVEDGIVEWIDIEANPKIVSALAGTASKSIIRFHGKEFIHDHEVTPAELWRLKTVYGFRELLIAGEAEPIIEEEPAKKKAAPLTIERDDSDRIVIRTFTDITGKFSLKARFAGYDSGQVTLEKEDGKKIQIPIEKLSEADRKWLEDWLKSGAATTDLQNEP